MTQKTVAIVLAAGQGKRMQSAVPKQYLLIKERPILYYTLQAFEQSFVDEIVLVVGDGEQDYCQKEFVEKYAFTKIRKIVCGGKERYHSVYAGLEAISEEQFTYVFIHDGARPFITEEILTRAYHIVQDKNACVVGMPVKDTVKIVDENAVVMETPDRSRVWQVQTPQVFTFSLIYDAYKQLMKEEQNLLEKDVNITDDAMVVEYFTDTQVVLVEGSYTNIKITTPEDLKIGTLFVP